jgi:hypothetical protein
MYFLEVIRGVLKLIMTFVDAVWLFIMSCHIYWDEQRAIQFSRCFPWLHNDPDQMNTCLQLAL